MEFCTRISTDASANQRHHMIIFILLDLLFLQGNHSTQLTVRKVPMLLKNLSDAIFTMGKLEFFVIVSYCYLNS
jgi:hypothetical protein